MENLYTWAVIVSGGLLVLGCVYAILISVFPLNARLTWLEVVIGMSGVTIAASAIIYILVAEPGMPEIPEWAVLVGVFWWCLGIAGGPMIVGQVVKNHYLERDWKIRQDVEVKLKESLGGNGNTKETLAREPSGGEGQTSEVG